MVSVPLLVSVLVSVSLLVSVSVSLVSVSVTEADTLTHLAGRTPERTQRSSTESSFRIRFPDSSDTWAEGHGRGGSGQGRSDSSDTWAGDHEDNGSNWNKTPHGRG